MLKSGEDQKAGPWRREVLALAYTHRKAIPLTRDSAVMKASRIFACKVLRILRMAAVADNVWG